MGTTTSKRSSDQPTGDQSAPMTGNDLRATHFVYELLECAGEQYCAAVALQMGKIFIETENGTTIIVTASWQKDAV